MIELLEKMGPHDMGGDEAGPIDTVDHGMSHWEKHANAVRMTVSGIKVHLLDGKVHYIESNPDHPVNKGVMW
jgi:hypothetical protein